MGAMRRWSWIGWTLLGMAWALILCALLGWYWPVADAFASFLPFAGVLALFALPMAPRRARWGFVGLGIVALGLVGWPILREIGARPSAIEPPAGAERLVVVTHNLHGGVTTPDRAAAVLRNSGADVLLLQEARQAGPLLARLARDFPYRSHCQGCELAILSRRPMGRVHWRLTNRVGQIVGPALFRGDVTLPGGAVVTVATVHAPWPYPPQPHTRFRRSLIDGIRETGSDRMVLSGDFNLTPWGHGMAELDRGLSPMRRITRALFSFPAQVAGRDWPVPLLPIDQIFIGRGIRFGRVDVLPYTGSDHRAIRAELYVSGRPAP